MLHEAEGSAGGFGRRPHERGEVEEPEGCIVACAQVRDGGLRAHWVSPWGSQPPGLRLAADDRMCNEPASRYTYNLDSMEINLSDAEIVLRIGNGQDPETEAELCKRMGPRARLYGLRHLRDRHAAEDPCNRC